jgi:6-pyruvoyltetrahydropterin/6-carboxytetrahydropterin synthase
MPDSSVKPVVSLTRRYRFSAAHRLHAASLSDAENREIYGKCNNPYGHGHDYVLEVTVRGPVEADRGRVLPVDALDRFVHTAILDGMDRRNLNVEVEEFASLVPTTENLSLVVARRLQQAWGLAFEGSPARLEKVKIHETKRNIFEVPIGQS